jgi:hypothetical protein
MYGIEMFTLQVAVGSIGFFLVFTSLGYLLYRAHAHRAINRLINLLEEDWQSVERLQERMEREGFDCSNVSMHWMLQELEGHDICEHRDRLLDISSELSIDLTVREYRLKVRVVKPKIHTSVLVSAL